ncbi:type I polyketide synthase [Streptomyces sp. NPDC098789]|uniref:type I polyketide synthase n=1 Tax=Streptomyces sp. NPDC098789 TaxID=3366098 RepID=UPI0037FE23B4
MIGLSCRLPQADSSVRLWELLRDGVDAITPLPSGRWPQRSAEAAELTSERGGFLDRVDQFDADFFGISPREAAAMDPQQRLALELGWELLENGGITPERMAALRAGVFVGAMNDDYATLTRQRSSQAVSHHTLAGLQRSMIANRLSYLLGVNGPSLTVDSGQSSSLVAVHMACQSLRAGECEIALAGGVNLNLSFDGTLSVSRFGGLSPDGRCYTFDARANGYVRGEGGGFVLLKPLAQALRDGDHIHGVLRGSAVNNGGGDSLTTPSQQAQEDVLRRAHTAAGVRPEDIQYVELHGTGTAVGDPIEAAALAAVIGSARPTDAPLQVGSAKTNVGHLEGAAGIVGLLKVLLSLEAGELPASLNFETPNPAIPLADWHLQVQTERSPWPRPDVPLLAGVSSFGLGGTNAHVIVEQAPVVEPAGAAKPGPAVGVVAGGGVVPWVLSGKSAAGLCGQAVRLREFVTSSAVSLDVSLADVGHSLVSSRAGLEHRAVVLGSSREELVAGLEAVAAGEPAEGVVSGVRREGASDVVFVFPGQGAQWAGMAVGLLDSSRVFAERFGACAAALTAYVDWVPVDVLREREGAPSLDRVDVVQPMLWAVMVSLAQVWRAHGVEPAAVIGHSQGELAAAVVAGVLSVEDGARIVALRSQLIGRELAGLGGMVSVPLGEDVALELIEPWVGRISVATINGPRSTVVAGEAAALDELMAVCERGEIRARRIPVDYGSHTPQVERLREALLELAAPVAPRAGDVPMYSTVTARLLEGGVADAEYWFRNLRQPVRFEETVRGLIADGHVTFLEVSAHPVLTSPVEETGEAMGVEVFAGATLRRDQGGSRRFLSSLGELWVRGGTPDWSAVFDGSDARRVALPTYAFQTKHYWLDSAVADPEAAGAVSVAGAAVGTYDGSGAGGAHDVSPDVSHAVRAHTAAVLGHATAEEVDVRRSFKDLGFDSIMLGDLRSRLNTVLGRRLTTAALFSHPTPARLAAHLESVRDDRTGERRPAAVTVREPDRDRAVDGAEDPIAIVAMSCRFPGGVSSPEDLWQLVSAGQDAISDYPDDRGWDLERLLSPDGRGRVSTGVGGFIDGATDFDPRFFGISPREALAMDPQQRLLLETSWELLERAGIDPELLRGSRTGVFVGTMDQEYGPRLHEAPETLDGLMLTGKTTSVASGRIAYVLGLTGPALTVDTACSSSLVALHLAVASLRRGECSLALAGGATVLSTPGIFTEMTSQQGLALDGRCKAFAGAADGTGFSEGVGMLLVERLSDARRNGHRVLAVVRGSAINQDGASNGLTAPNGLSQQQVIRDAWASAGLGSADVDMLEAHGTGTALGDPIEAEALLATYGQDRPEDRPLLLGSLKSNIGHTQAAAGVAGVIKSVLAIRHGLVPATLHVDGPTPEVDWSTGAVRLATESTPWPEASPVRRAGVSSFGISGTNAHVILEQAPVDAAAPAAAPLPGARLREGGPLPWIVSGRTAAGLRAQAARLRRVAADSAATDEELGRALATTRSALEHRAVVVAEDREMFLAGLDALETGGSAAHVFSGRVSGEPGGVVFVFPGQGAQWAGMAVELLDSSPVFAERFAACAAALTAYVDWVPEDVLRQRTGAPSYDRVDVVQPMLWAVMVSLAAVWRASGVQPAAVVGHSQGELAAAVVAGVLSVEDGARIVALRSQLIGRELAGQGGMVSVPLGEDVALELIEPWVGRISVATINGPRSTVVAGEAAALDELMAVCERGEVRARRIPVDYGSHTAQVERLREALLELAAPVSPRAGDVPMYSTVTGGLLEGGVADAEYWFRNLRQPVRFEETVRGLIADGHVTFLEVSAHPVLTSPVEETGEAMGVEVFAGATLRRDQGGSRRFLSSLSELWVRGGTPDWSAVYAPVAEGAEPVELPTYAFQRDRYWLAPSAAGAPVQVELPSAPVAEPVDGFRQKVLDAPTASRRLRIVLDEVCTQAAAVLGWASAHEVEVGRAFREAGFDSLTAVDLRNRLGIAIGQPLAQTAVFDYPTPLRLAEHLRDRILGADGSDGDDAEAAALRSRTTSGASGDEPIAIVATSCRFPGDIRSPDDLWRLLLDGQDVISGLPQDRGWDLDALYDPDSSRAGTSYVDQGGFLHDAGQFDAGFFGISPREAVAMDPQQRLLLETSWEAVERAGLDPETLRGSRTGVFVGAVPHGYGADATNAQESGGYLFTGAAGSVASGRISYSFGLTGPAMTVDTACSSSLVALHLAVQALRHGECSMALAGGVTVMSTPGVFTEFSQQRGLAPDGLCKPFAAAADGTAWGEGVGVLLLEPLAQAQRNGHQVLAVIRGSAVNQDGASNGLTAPNGPSQQRVIRQALANAQLEASDIDVVEAHGTGTALGDPIEAQALLATYGQDRPEDRPLLLGSLKSNLGHTSAVAGIAGVIKVVEAMRHGVVPATLHVDEPTPKVDWSSGAVELVTEGRAWPETGRVRRAGVSSFGVSGTNAHVIVEQAPVVEQEQEQEQVPVAEPAGGVVPWVLSGKSAAGLCGQAVRLREFVTSSAVSLGVSLADVGHSLVSSRAGFEHRAVVLGSSREELVAALEAVAAGEPAEGVVSGVRREGASDVVFVFPGQGAQWAGMAVGLLDSSRVFAERFGACAAALAPYVDWVPVDVLREREGAPSLDRVDVVQPMLWAVMVSLAAVWRASGVQPAAVVGHSQGELAAAVVAGVLSLEDAARIVALRSLLIGRELAGRGGMVSLPLAADAALELIEPWSGRVSVATVNGPRSTVVAGEAEALDELMAVCERDEVRARRIPVDYGSHTAQVELLREALLELAAPVAPRAGDVPMYSTVTGGLLEGGVADAEYWFRNLRQPVRFEETVRGLIADGHVTFLEVSAHPVLTSPVEETGEAMGVEVFAGATLRRGEGGPERWLRSLAQLWVQGGVPDWQAVFADTGARRVELPTYAFQTKHYWFDTAPARAAATADPHAAFWEVVEREDLEGLAKTLRLNEEQAGLTSVLPALAAWHKRHAEAAGMESWRYRAHWKSLPSGPKAALSGTWLVAVTPDQLDGALYETVAGALRAQEAVVEPLVVRGAEDAGQGGNPWAEALAAHSAAAGVLSLLAQDESPLAEASVTPAGFAQNLALLQQLEAADSDAVLWCVTQGAVSIGERDPLTSPAQALVWGLGRVAAQELPTRWGGLVDLPREPDGRALARLCDVLAAGPDEDQVAVRSTATYGRRLVRAPLTGALGDGWTPGKGTVLITGGTGALGSQVAKRLAAQGAEHLLLVSRQGGTAPGATDLEAELAATGARVTTVACDVADPEALRHLLDSVPDDCPLAAVVHTAAVLDDGALTTLTPEQLDRVLRVKAAVAHQLHLMTQDMGLSAFVLFSSLAGTVGMAGQGNYAPGNAYLDALAQYRRAQGLAATSVAWGSWARGGMAGRDVVGDTSIRHGVPLLPPERATVALETALAHGDTSLVIADIDWERFAYSYTAARPSRLLDELPEARAVLTRDEPTDAAATLTLAERLAGLAPAERERQLRTAVRQQVAAVLGHDSGETVELRRRFLEMGLDSVTAVELRNRLNAATGLRLPATIVFDCPTVHELVRYLGDALFGDNDAAVGSTDAPAPGTAELDQLEELLGQLPDGDPGRSELARRLRQLLRTASGPGVDGEEALDAEDLESASNDDLFKYIGKEFGIS